MESSTQTVFKRRYPRREFISQVGVLVQGKYFLQHTFELGEKGMMFDLDLAIRQGQDLICTFYLPDGYFVVTQAQVKSVAKDEKVKYAKVGVEFTNINFEDRRKVRDFISQRKDKTQIGKFH